MKAQMFIITMVFLVGLVFTVQQILLQYVFLDLPAQFQRDDFYLMQNIRDAFNQTLQVSNCASAPANLGELADFMKQQIGSKYVIDLENTLSTLNCTSFGTNNPSLILKIHLIGPDTDTRNAFNLYK